MHFVAMTGRIGSSAGDNLRKVGWVIFDKKHGRSLVPIPAVAREHDLDPEMRPHRKLARRRPKKKMIVGAPGRDKNI